MIRVGGRGELLTRLVIGDVPGVLTLPQRETPHDQAEPATDEIALAVPVTDEIKVSTRQRGSFEVMDEVNAWRPISSDSIVVRLWDPHPRRGWEADSWGRHAMGAMLKLDMLNKRIIATIVSRLAGNGFLLYDSGRLSIPKNQGPTEDGQENPDPFAEQMVAVGGKSIADPMSAEALIPIPIGVDIGDGENFNPDLLMRHLTFDNPLDQKLLELRESAIRELARDSDMPADILLGLGDVNHWSAWQIEESGIKIHVSPKAETIVHGLTKGYLIPTLRAGDESLIGPNGGRLIVWYDVSEITQRPDRSSNFVLAYDRFEVNGTALRREIGADEDDAPSKRELVEMIRKRIAGNPLVAPSVLAALGDSDVAPPDDAEGSGEEPPAEGDEQPETGPPDTQEDEPPAPDEGAIAAALLAVVGRPVSEWTYDDIAAALLQLGVNAEQAAMIAALKTLGEETRKSVFVPAGTPVENRATPARRNGTRTATDTTE